MELLAATSFSQFKELSFQSQLILDSISNLAAKAEESHFAAGSMRPLKELVLFAKFHFACEEKLLRAYEHPLLDSYLTAHQSAFQMIDALMGEIERGNEVEGRLCATVLRIIGKQLESENCITHQMHQVIKPH